MPFWSVRGRIARLVAASILLSVSSGALAAVDPSDLLPVDDAFALTASAPTRDRVELHWAIADGYYLYRHRIGAQSTSAAFVAGPLQVPHGERHRDPYFGDVETFRGEVTAVQRGTAGGDATRATLKVKYQGCADAGVCYPPQIRTLTVTLPPAEPIAGGGDAGPSGLRGVLGGGGPMASGLLGSTRTAEPLPAEQAFAFEAIVDGPRALLLRFTPAKGYYLYRDKTSLQVSRPAGTVLGRPAWPAGTPHRDEHFGDVIVYFDQVDVPLPLRQRPADATALTLVATFQGCQTGGICYPPMTRSVSLELPADAVGAGIGSATAPPPGAKTTDVAEPAPKAAADVPATVPAVSDTRGGALVDDTGGADDSRLATALAGSGRWLALLGFFGAGLLLAFTPCVLPMIPILSGLIAGHGTRLGTGRALLLSLVYVLANAVVFTIAGVFAGLAGANLQAAFQTPWIIVAFAGVFVALALSSFGLFELQLPLALRSRLGAITDRQRGGSLAGVAAMGALSALIVGPCVAPPLAGAVLYIGQSHDPVFGGAALFLLAMGMGAPLLAFGVAAGRGFPTSGPWMTTVQRAFGFLFLGLAVWMLSRVLPGAATLAAWGLLALAAAAWVSTTATGAAPRRWIARFAALVLAVVGAAQLLGALAGGNDPLQPLAGVAGARQANASLQFQRIKSAADLDRALAGAAAAGKPVLFDFYADWCVSCKEMEHQTFTDPAVHAAVGDFVLLQADVTANDAVDQALMRRFGIIGPPATLFFSAGTEHRALRLVGFEPVAPFLARVRRAAMTGPE